MSVFGNAGCGGPDGNGTRGANLSWSVEIFLMSALLRRVRGAMMGVSNRKWLDVRVWWAWTRPEGVSSVLLESGSNIEVGLKARGIYPSRLL